MFVVYVCFGYSDKAAWADFVLSTVKAGNYPSDIGYDTVNWRMYVTNFDDWTVSVIDISTNKIIFSPIAVGQGPTGIASAKSEDVCYKPGR